MSSFYSKAKEETQRQIAEMRPQLQHSLNEMKSRAVNDTQILGRNVMDEISAKIPNGVNLSHYDPNLPIQGSGKKGKKGGVKEEWEAEEPDPYDEYKGVLDPPEEVEKPYDPYDLAVPDYSGGKSESKPKKAKKTGCLPCKANEAHGGAWKMKKKRAKSRSRSRSRGKNKK